MNFLVSIDGGAQTPYQFDGICETCNVTFFAAYDIQSLQYGDHTLSVTLLDATGINAQGNYTAFYFNDAIVNEADTFLTQTISSTVATGTPSSVATYTSSAAAHTSTISSAAAHTSTTSTAAAHISTTSTAAPPSSAPSTSQ
jgi:hypothetical protein